MKSHLGGVPTVQLKISKQGNMAPEKSFPRASKNGSISWSYKEYTSKRRNHGKCFAIWIRSGAAKATLCNESVFKGQSERVTKEVNALSSKVPGPFSSQVNVVKAGS